QWRSWATPDGRHIDQLETVLNQLKNDPDSRRIIVSAWNVGELLALTAVLIILQPQPLKIAVKMQVLRGRADGFVPHSFLITLHPLLYGRVVNVILHDEIFCDDRVVLS
ncbi:thymidylate synthase, partial [Cronobacter sakazakii]|uniref:thymidylate synthase n=1 Tax=Cronobacter sakazakii TaxID=28141 RepID=UPI001F1B451A